jgi:hypothetical protein
MSKREPDTMAEHPHPRHPNSQQTPSKATATVSTLSLGGTIYLLVLHASSSHPGNLRVR